MAGRRLKRVGIAGAGVAAGVAGGLAVQHAVARRYEKAPEVAPLVELQPPAGVRSRQIAVSDGGSIHVIEDGPPGSGPAVLLLHGITLSSAVWHYQLRDVAAAGYRVAAMDFRGHGLSQAGTDGLTIDRLAADVEEVIAALGLTQVVLGAHSLGGMVALRVLARNPAWAAGEGPARPEGPAGRAGPAGGPVSGLVVVATSASPVRRRGLPLARGLVAAARPLLIRTAALTERLPGPTLPAHDLAFLLARIVFGSEASPGEVSFTGEMTSEVPARVSAQLLLEILRFDEEQTVGAIRVPVVVVVGDHDLMTPVAHAEALAAAVPGARLVVLPGCGHMVMLERRTEMSQALLGLLGSVGSVGGRAAGSGAATGGAGAGGRGA